MLLKLVAAAILQNPRGEILLAQRPMGKAYAGFWEFPGGKVELGESPEQALVRELQEELGIVVDTTHLSPLTFASHTYPEFHLLMPVYGCRQWVGVVTAKEQQQLAWLNPSTLPTRPDVLPADVPLIPRIMAWAS